MIVVQSDELLVRIDPLHGGEILDLVDCGSGRQLLGRPPFGSADRAGGVLDERTWTAAYRGGWQLLAPNAGNACVVDGEPHGFHGTASSDPWAVVAVGRTAATLQWEGHGLRITRVVDVSDASLDLRTTYEAIAGRVPFVAVEHCAVGLELLDPAVEIRLPPGTAYELTETDGPVHPPADAPVWPSVRLLNWEVERGDRHVLADRIGRFLVVADLPIGEAEIFNARTGTALSLAWDAQVLPHLWIWQEVRHTDGAWRNRGEILAVEPASVPHSLGLATAIENDQAHWAEPGAPVIQRVTARVVRDADVQARTERGARC